MQCRHADSFEEWAQKHPEEPPCRRRPFTLQQIEELKQQHSQVQAPPEPEASPPVSAVPGPSSSWCSLPIVLSALSVTQAPLGPITCHTVQAVAGAEPSVLSQGSLEGATIIYEQGE